VGSPEVGADLHGGAALLATALLSAPAVIAYLIEFAVLAAADRWPRRPVLVAALLAMSAGSVLAAMSVGPVSLTLGLAVWGTAVGIATGVGEILLVSGSADPDRAMTRWGLASSLGDLLGPPLVAASLALGGSWREVLLATAVLPALNALLVARGPEPAEARPARRPAPPADEEEPLRVALPAVVADRALLRWLVAAAGAAPPAPGRAAGSAVVSSGVPRGRPPGRPSSCFPASFPGDPCRDARTPRARRSTRTPRSWPRRSGGPTRR
jgi:MFS family permease